MKSNLYVYLLAIILLVTVAIQLYTIEKLGMIPFAPKEIIRVDTVKVKDEKIIYKLRRQIREDAQYIHNLEKNYDKCRQMLVGDTTSTN